MNIDHAGSTVLRIWYEGYFPSTLYQPKLCVSLKPLASLVSKEGFLWLKLHEEKI